MQKISLINFENDLKSIQEYIKHINIINGLAKKKFLFNEEIKKFNEHLYYFRVDKKIFEYKSIVISLYGILEKYINIWIKEHIDTLIQLIPIYKDLPAKIRDNHFTLSIRLISLINENKFSKNDNLKKEEVLINLSSCFNDLFPYRFNTDAFLPLSGNLKYSKISEAFKIIDIQLTEKLKKDNDFTSFLKEKYGENIENRDDSILFNIIDDLVIRRNDIAHGSVIDDILDIEKFSDYIEFFKNYGKAVFEILIEKEIQYEANYVYEEIPIEAIRDIFRNSILCVNLENRVIKVGDYIIVKRTNGNYLKKEILEIQIDNISFVEKKITIKTDIGINLGNGLKQNQTFYIKK